LLDAFECASLSALLKRTATITQAGVGSRILRSGTVAFETLVCAIEVAYIFALVKAITIKFLVWEKTTRKELHSFELTSKVTTEFCRQIPPHENVFPYAYDLMHAWGIRRSIVATNCTRRLWLLFYRWAGRPTVLTPANKNFSRLLTLICLIRR